MHIIRLEAENVKRLKAVRITPEGSVVTIAGENGQGKTSVLDSIVYALGGKDTHPPEVIRRGQETAQVVVDLGDVVVTRRWHADTAGMKGGTNVEVRSKDGAKYPSPQAMLDKLIGPHASFDPMAFLELPPKQQAEQVRKLAGLDFTELDKRRQIAFDKRSEVNAQGKAMRARFDAMPAPAEGLPEKPVSIDQLLAEQDKLQEEKRANDGVRQLQRELEQKAAEARTKAARSAELVENLRAQLRLAEADLVKDEAHAEQLGKERDAFAPRVQALVDPDVADVYRRMKQLEATNDSIRAAAARKHLGAELEALRETKQKLENELTAIDASKAEALKKAKLPVEGLGFTDDGVTLDGFPLEQASEAQRIRLSVAMKLAASPELKVVLLPNAALLDAKRRQLVSEIITAAGAQVWFELPTVDKSIGIIIEDGEVASAEPSPLKLVK